MSKSPVPTPHLEAKVGDIAETVLLPGCLLYTSI